MPGSKRRNPAASLVGLGLMVVCPAGLAEDTDEAPLSEAFLEFLAESEDEQGEWQDPMDYEGQQWQVLDQKTEKTDE
jgi:hypothetical protein